MRRPGPQNCQGPNDDWHNGPADWAHRNVDQAGRDHQPFNWNGQWVQPMPAGNGDGPGPPVTWSNPVTPVGGQRA